MALCRYIVGPVENGGNAHRFFVGVLLGVEDAVRAHVVAVVGEIDLQGVFEARLVLQAFVEAADIPVEVFDHGVVGRQVLAHFGRVVEVVADGQGVGVEALPLFGCDKGKVRRCHREHQEERLGAVVVADIVNGPVGEHVGLVAIQRRRVAVVEFVDRAIKVAVEVFEAVPVLEAGAVELGQVRLRENPPSNTPVWSSATDGGYLVADDAAVPLAEIGGAIAGLAQLGGGAGGGGFEYVEEAGDRAGVGVAATEDGAARGGADGAVGVGAGKAGAL